MTATPLYKVPTGTELVLNGCPLRVVAKDAHGYLVEASDSHERRHIAYQARDRAIAMHDRIVTPPEQSEKLAALREYTGGIRSLSQLPAAEQAAIEQRVAFVQAMMEMEGSGVKLTQRNLDHAETRKALLSLAQAYAKKVYGLTGTSGGKYRKVMPLPKGRTLQKYLTLYKRHDGNPLALMHRDNLKGPQGDARKKLTPLQESFIASAAWHWTQPVKVRLAKVFRYIAELFREKYAEFAQPSIATLRKRVKKLSAVFKENRREGANKTWNDMSAGVTDIRAISFGERVEIDECCLSIAVNKSGAVEARRIDADKAHTKAVKGALLQNSAWVRNSPFPQWV